MPGVQEVSIAYCFSGDRRICVAAAEANPQGRMLRSSVVANAILSEQRRQAGLCVFGGETWPIDNAQDALQMLCGHRSLSSLDFFDHPRAA